MTINQELRWKNSVEKTIALVQQFTTTLLMLFAHVEQK